ncbi:MAG: cupin domain-containing protein [Alphaproteobacteria bacterium]|nr:MAG: cupin domain-containing protein [Alphaproteobacteria bacterium]
MDDQDGIGLKLKAVRTARGLSQRKLAARAGVANATISQIESGALNPTVGVLKKILGAVDFSLGEFFGDDLPANEEKIFFLASELKEISEGGVSYRQVGRDMMSKAIQILYERYQPGSSTGRHALRHTGEEGGIILKGELTVTVGTLTQTLRPGDAYYFKSDQPHSFRNKCGEVCELITACTPPTI